MSEGFAAHPLLIRVHPGLSVVEGGHPAGSGRVIMRIAAVRVSPSPANASIPRPLWPHSSGPAVVRLLIRDWPKPGMYYGFTIPASHGGSGGTGGAVFER